MTQVQDWSVITVQALQTLWQGFIGFLPEIVGALIVFVVGWFVSIWIGKLVAEILKRLRVDRLFESTEWEKAMERAEFKMKISEFIGAIVKWAFIIVFLLAAVEILGLYQFAGFLKAVVNWLPNLIIATAIFVVTVILAEFAEKIIRVVVGKMDVRHVSFIGTVVKWAIWIFAILAILSQLKVAPVIVDTLIKGFVALIVISSSLAFGLGGKDMAKNILEDLRNKF